MDQLRSRAIPSTRLNKLYPVPSFVIQLYWHPGTLIILHIAHNVFASQVDLLGQKSGSPQSLKYLLSGPLQKKFADLCLGTITVAA